MAKYLVEKKPHQYSLTASLRDRAGSFIGGGRVAHSYSVRLHSKPMPSSDLEIERDPHGGVVTGIYFTTHPPVYTAFNESAGNGW